MALVTMVSTYEDGTYTVTGPHTLYTGAVLRTFSRCERIMSDVYADVTYAECWDAEKGKLVEWAYANSEFGYHSHHLSVEVDATPETLAAVAAYKVKLEEAAAAAREAAKEAARQAELATPRKGKVVVVARGRKVKKGTTGTVIWYGAGKSFGYGPAPMRAGVKDANGEVHWVDAKHLDVLAQSESESAVAA
jgi:biotin carboxyl carrier protein